MDGWVTRTDGVGGWVNGWEGGQVDEWMSSYVSGWVERPAEKKEYKLQIRNDLDLSPSWSLVSYEKTEKPPNSLKPQFLHL